MIYYIHFIISLFAAFVVGIVSICTQEEFMKSITHILITLISFFIIGIIVKKIMVNMINKNNDNLKDKEISEDTDKTTLNDTND